MKPPKEPSARSAMECLGALGCAVEVIAHTDQPRADLRATWGPDEYIVEAKGRDLSVAIRQLHREASKTGAVTHTRDLEPSNAVSSKLLRAAEQLASTPGRVGAFRLIWVLAAHEDEAFELECVARTLHGKVQVSIIDPMALTVSVKTCYYYSANDFIRMPEVCGAILCGAHGFRLLVNSFSEARVAFRRSVLYGALADAGAIEDPELIEAQGDAFLIGSDFRPSSAGKDCWRYLLDKYGARTSLMREVQFQGLAVWPLPKE
jgi:hypothetical protein